MKKSISIVLLATILLQSCVVYQKAPVPISESIEKGKAKVITKTGTKFKFKNIILEDEKYFGIQGKNKILIGTEGISAIYLKDINKSETLGALIGVGFTVAIIVVGFLFIFALFDPDTWSQ